MKVKPTTSDDKKALSKVFGRVNPKLSPEGTEDPNNEKKEKV